MKEIQEQKDLNIQANVKLEKFDAETGEKLDEINKHNIVTTVGLNKLRDFLAGSSLTAPSHFALGTDGTTEGVSDTDLGTEVFRDAFTETINVENGVVKWKYYLASGDANGNTLAEAGIFNDSTAGDMYARVTFAGEEKTSAEAWTFTWSLTFQNA